MIKILLYSFAEPFYFRKSFYLDNTDKKQSIVSNKLGEPWFDDYWMNYNKITATNAKGNTKQLNRRAATAQLNTATALSLF